MFAKADRSKIKPIKLPVRYSKLAIEDRKLIREEYIKEQYGMCYYCECALSGEPSFDVVEIVVSPDLFPEEFFAHPVHLHHNHDTDMTIGAVHAHCNAVMWEHDGE